MMGNDILQVYGIDTNREDEEYKGIEMELAASNYYQQVETSD